MRATGFVLLALSLSLPGCASIMKGSSQSISIASPPADGATCTLSSGQGSWMVVTPGVVTVERSKQDLQARCVKPGYDDGIALIPSNFEGWTVGNLVFGGVIGVGVDAATGAINEYPRAFQIPMHPIQASIAPAAPLEGATSRAPATGGPTLASKPVADEPAKPKPAKPKPAAAAAAAGAAPASTATAATP